MTKDQEEKDKKIDKKQSFKEKDPNKYVDLEPTLNRYFIVSESKSKTLVLTFGRFSPPTVGHEKLVNKIITEAASRKADAAVYTSHTQDKKKNPLSYEDKISFMKTAFGKIVKPSKSRTLIEVLKEVDNKYDNIVVVVGADRVPEFSKLLNNYNGKEYNFDDIEVISAGERDPDADDVTGMSASKMRALATQKDLEGFRSGLPKKLKSKAEEVYNAVLKGMKIMEDFEQTDDTLEEKVVPLSYAARRKRGLTMKRYAGKIARMRERALKRRSTPEKLLKKARRRALDFIKKRLAGKRAYSDLTPSEKIMVDKRASRIPDAAIERIARKQIPQVRKIEAERLSSLAHPKEDISTRGVNIKVNEEFENFMENFYSDIASEGEKRQSLHNKSFHSMYKKEGTVKTDGRFRFFRRKVNESLEDVLSEATDLMESVESLFGEMEEGVNDPSIFKAVFLAARTKSEGVNSDRVKEQIAAEKKSDSTRHKRMMDRARMMDKNMRESSEYIKKIIDREQKHKKIAHALKKFSDKISDIPPEEHLDHAAGIISSLKLNFAPKELVDLHRRIKNAKSFEKAYANVDAWESVNPANISEAEVDPAKREWGTSSLTKTYRDDTPGQEDMDIDEEFSKVFGEDYYAGLSKSTAAKRKAHFAKGAKMDDDNPRAYKPAPGDASAETKPSVHTKKYKEMFKEEDLEESEKGLRNKAAETGISYGILKQVYDRGVAAWRTGHRPGTTPSQWGFARVNSFATGGKTRTTTDKDLWAKHKGKSEAVEEIDVKESLWANIRARRAKGLPRKKPGEKGYPKTLDIE